MAGSEIAAEEFLRWIRAPDALATLRVKFNGGQVATETLLRHFRLGRLRMVASERHWVSRPPAAHMVLVEPSWIANIGLESSVHTFWTTGDLSASVSGDSGRSSRRLDLIDVRFDPDALAEILQPKTQYDSASVAPAPISSLSRRIDHFAHLRAPVDGAAPTPPEEAVTALVVVETPPSRHAGGRPPKTYWEDALIALAAMLYSGAIIPERQADLEKAMLDWLSDNGHDASERSVRTRAQKLWPLIKPEGQ